MAGSGPVNGQRAEQEERMARTDVKSVDDYIAAQPAEVRPVLEQVRAAIRKAIPKAEEVISYQIPAYKLDGQTVIFFAGFKGHFSLYPIAGATIRERPSSSPMRSTTRARSAFPSADAFRSG
jgi:hypothetical protein